LFHPAVAPLWRLAAIVTHHEVVGSNRVRTLMVFETLMLFNGLLCAGVGWILLIFMSKPAGLVGALIFWAVATLLWEGKRYVDRLLPFDGSHRGRSRVRRS
jgi:hypothetical protein